MYESYEGHINADYNFHTAFDAFTPCAIVSHTPKMGFWQTCRENKPADEGARTGVAHEIFYRYR